MNIEEYQFDAKRLINLKDNNENFTYLILTVPLAKISIKDCLFWTIEIIIPRLKSLEQNELSSRTIKELEKLKENYNSSKANIFDELSHKNWLEKGKGEKEFLINLPLSRICWACLYFVCQENKLEFKSKFRGNNNIPKKAISNLNRTIGGECGFAIDITFREKGEEAYKIAKSYTKLIKKIENKENHS